MDISPKLVNSIGLVFDLIGALLIGFEFFKKYKDDRFRPDAGMAVDPDRGLVQQSEVQPTDEYKAWESRREKVAIVGLTFLCTGFALQILANWV